MSSARVGSFKKVDAILDVFSKNPELLVRARENVVTAVGTTGFDLSPGELVILVDVVSGSRQSPLNKMPKPPTPNPPREATVDLMEALRSKWKTITSG